MIIIRVRAYVVYSIILVLSITQTYTLISLGRSVSKEEHNIIKKENDSLLQQIDISIQRESELQAKIKQLETKIANPNLTDVPETDPTDTPKVSEEKPNKGTPSPSPAVPVGSKVAYLTFDDGPSPNTAKILDILKEHNISATFFVNGTSSTSNKALYKRILDEGHALGNHTYSHDYSAIYTSAEDFEKDFNELQVLLKETTGIEPTIMRFPGGSDNRSSWSVGGEDIMKSITQHMYDLGYIYFDWNVTSSDASVHLLEEETIISEVLSGSKKKNNAVILMHDSKPKTTTVDALPEIIDGLTQMGFRFEKLTETSPTTQFLHPSIQ